MSGSDVSGSGTDLADSAVPSETAEDANAFVLTLTPEALAKVHEIREGEDDPGMLCLRVEITGTAGTEYAYDLAFAEISSLEAEDDLSVQDGLSVVVAAESIDRMRGATLDLPRTSGQAGLVIRNPNRPTPPNPFEGRDIVLTGDIAEKVTQLLVESINPGLASHGGFAELVGVDDTTVFITMGGGCQGCAMSAATLRDGIQTAIREAIPEVTEIIDATDHTAGDNPFYT
jgi:Fe/S biogenesis protein NfuA